VVGKLNPNAFSMSVIAWCPEGPGLARRRGIHSQTGDQEQAGLYKPDRLRNRATVEHKEVSIEGGGI
jgi:hypothetical protein